MSPFSWTTPITFLDGAGNGPTAAEMDTLSNDLAFLHQEFPIRATLWHKDSTVVVGNDIDTVVASSQDFGHYAYQNANADEDSFEQSFPLLAGTYTVHFLGQTTTQSGKVDWAIDGTQIKAGQDWFNNPIQANIEKTVASVVIADTDRHTITGAINDNNPSSGDFELRLTKIWFEPAGDVV